MINSLEDYKLKRLLAERLMNKGYTVTFQDNVVSQQVINELAEEFKRKNKSKLKKAQRKQKRNMQNKPKEQSSFVI
jgi:predicted nucleic acid-binding protein